MKQLNSLPALPVAAFAVLLALLVASFVYDPVQKIENQVAEPIARAVDVLPDRCPHGWTREGGELDGNVKDSERCIRGRVVMTLIPGSDKGQYSLDTAGGPDAAPKTCRETAGWSASRCE